MSNRLTSNQFSEKVDLEQKKWLLIITKIRKFENSKIRKFENSKIGEFGNSQIYEQGFSNSLWSSFKS